MEIYSCMVWGLKNKKEKKEANMWKEKLLSTPTNYHNFCKMYLELPKLAIDIPYNQI